MKKKTEKKQRRWIRRILTYALVILILLLGFSAAIFIVPFQSRFLDAQIAQAFYRATRLQIAFESAIYHLAGGNATLWEIRIEAPETGQRVTDIARMDFRWKWRLWGAWPPLEPYLMEIAAPEPIVFHLEEDGRITPSPALRSSLDLLHTFEHQPAAPKEPMRPIKIVVRNHAVYLDEKPDADAPPEMNRLAGIESMDIEIQYSSAGIWPLLVSGHLRGEQPASVAASISAGTGGKGYAFYLETSFLDSEDHFRKPLPFYLSGQEIRISGHIAEGESPETSHFDLSTRGKNLRVLYRDSLELPETDIELQTAGFFNFTSRTLQLQHADAQTPGVSLSGKGRIAFEGLYPFALEIASCSLSTETLHFLQTLAPSDFPRASIASGNIQLSGRVSGRCARDQGGLDAFQLSVEGKNLLTSFPQTGILLPRTEANFRVAAAYDSACRTLLLDNLELRAFQSSVSGNAEMAFEETLPFSAEITGASLAPEILNPLQTLMPETIPRTKLIQGKLQLRGRFSGDRAGIHWDACGGDIHATDLLAENAFWGGESPRIGPVALDARLTSAALELSRLSVQVLSNNLTVSSGRIARSANGPQKGREISGNWNLDAVAEEIVPLLPSKAAVEARKWQPRGAMRGLGTVRGELPATLPALADNESRSGASARAFLESVLDNLRLDGLFHLREVSVDHEKMPAPIEHFSGSIFLSNESLRFSDVKGSMMGSDMSVEGGASGSPYIWSEPLLDLGLRGDLDLSQAPQWITPDMRQSAMRAHLGQMAPTGRLGLNLQLNGPLYEPEKLTLSGTLAPADIGLTIETTSPTITLQNLRGTIELALPQKIHAPQLDMKLRGGPDGEPVEVSFSGSITNTGCNLLLKTEGDLWEYKELVPPIFSLFDVSGPITLEARFQTSLRPSPETALPGTLPELFAALRKEYESAESAPAVWRRFNDMLDWDLKADLLANGCEFTHIYMPARVTGIEGRFQIDRDGLRTQRPAKARWGSSETLTGGVITITPQGIPHIQFALSSPMLIVDEWAKPWGPKNRAASSWPHRHLPPFDPSMKADFPVNIMIDGTLTGEKASFQNFAMENASAHFEYWDYKESKGYLEFDRLKADLYEGDLSMNTGLFYYGPFFKWNVDIALEDVRCEQLLEAHHQRKSTVNGLLTMKMGLSGSTLDDSMIGNGTFLLRNSRFFGNPIFSALGQILRSRELEDISFTTMTSDFSLDGNELTIPKLSLEGPIIKLEGEGMATLDGQLDLIVIYRYLKLVPRIPIIREIVGVVEDATSWLVKMHLGGTLKDPVVRVIPFSTDRLNLGRFLPGGNARKTNP